VQRDTVGAYVMTIGTDGKVARKDVTTADMSGGNWVVTNGLAAGDQIVVSGIQNVKAGAPAKASPWHAATAGGSSSANAQGSSASPSSGGK
jgi:membrane fusion protein (multidrug efflux system)